MRPSGILIAALLVSACSRESERAPASSPAPISVATATAESVRVPRFQPLAGTVRPVDRAILSARVAGIVAERPPALGTLVRAGDTLLTLSAAEIDARLAEARATLDQIDRELARERRLFEQGASAAEDMRALEDRRRAMAASVDESAALSSYRIVSAPFAGVVTRRFVEQGDLASPGTPLLELEGTDRFRAEVSVPESLATPSPDQTLSIDIDGATVTGRLAEVSPAVDAASRSRLAKVELSTAAPNLSGTFVRVLWPAGSDDALLVPSDAVSSFGQMERVFVVSEGRAQLRLVRTAGDFEGRTRILSGLEPGETIVRQPPAGLVDGTPLDIRP